EGILYSEWVHDSRELPDQTQDRSRAVETIASYVASRSRELRFDADPASDLALEGRHKGLELLAGSLSRAYGSRIAAAARRPNIQLQLARQNRSAAALTDSKMSREEWIVAGDKLLKTDFEHHGQGKNELGMTDPAYDLASAIFQLGFSESESKQLISA